MLGRAQALARRLSTSRSRVEMTPRMAPLMRRWRVRARVSRPSMPGTFQRLRKSGRDSLERQLEGSLQHSLTSRARMCTRPDSMSSAVMP